VPLEKLSLQKLIEASPDIVVATDARSGTVAYYNDGAQETLGYARDEIIGEDVARLYPSRDEAKRVMLAMRSVGGEQGERGRVVNFQTKFVSNSGDEIPVAISGVILYDANGDEEGTVGFAKDLREFMRRDQLAVLGEIAIGLSHEINNPLEVIVTQLALIDRFVATHGNEDEVAGERVRIESVRREVHRIEGLLHRLSQMAEREEYSSTSYLGDARMIDLSPAERESAPLAGARVLVVDDDAGVRESLAELLTSEGCSVSKSGNGREALDELSRQSYDLVLSDVVMPEMDGYELFQETRRRAPKTQIVLMTAFYYDKDHVIKRSRMEGLEGVLFFTLNSFPSSSFASQQLSHSSRTSSSVPLASSTSPTSSPRFGWCLSVTVSLMRMLSAKSSLLFPR